MKNKTPDSFHTSVGEFANALVSASSEGKHVLIHVGGDWCAWCQRFTHFIEQHDDLAQLTKQQYISIKLYISEHGTGYDFLRYFPKMTAVPHLYIMNSQGELLHSQPTTRFEDGATYNHKRVRAFLTKWGKSVHTPLNYPQKDGLRAVIQKLIARQLTISSTSQP